ncbi:MAG TPA: GntR family transcriptional regulator [Metabacillus sp.]|nr:GntR family transcriptional regulator [Metabacillus sp.]
MFKLDEQSRNPKYEQLIEKIKDLIFGKAIKTGEKMPSIRLLSKEIRVNPNTVQKSYHELEKQGYLYSIKGKGYYVAPIDMILIEERIENELKPQFLRLLQI